jgi:hypothetical protein
LPRKNFNPIEEQNPVLGNWKNSPWPDLPGRVQEWGGDGRVPRLVNNLSLFGDEPSPPLLAHFLERALLAMEPRVGAACDSIGRVLCPGDSGEQHPAAQGPQLDIRHLAGFALSRPLAAVFKRWAYLWRYEPDR